MQIRAASLRVYFIVAFLSLLNAGGASVARADAASKAAKITELMQLTGARQFVHAVDGRFDQEDAVRAWGRFYSENVTEGDLDAILAFYRSPAGQKDVVASRRATTAAALASPPAAPLAPGWAAPDATKVNTVASASAPAMPEAAPVRPWDSNPQAPNGRVIPNSSMTERCEIAPPLTSVAHAAPPSGRSVVCVCADEKGALTREPVIAESSGDSRVDSGAIKMARSDSGRYIPPTLDGHPRAACFRFAIDFRRHQ